MDSRNVMKVLTLVLILLWVCDRRCMLALALVVLNQKNHRLDGFFDSARPMKLQGVAWFPKLCI